MAGRKRKQTARKGSGSGVTPAAVPEETPILATPVRSVAPSRTSPRTQAATSRKRKVSETVEPETEHQEEEKIEEKEVEQVEEKERAEEMEMNAEEEGKEEKNEQQVEIEIKEKGDENDDGDEETPIGARFAKKKKTTARKSSATQSPLVGSTSSGKKKKRAPMGTPADTITPKRFTTSAKKEQPSMEERLAHFRKCKILPGKFVDVPLFLANNCEQFVMKIRAQGWESLFTEVENCCDRAVREFYVNCSVKSGTVTSNVGGVAIEFNSEILGEFLGIPAAGFDVYVDGEWKNFGEDMSALGICRKFSRDFELDKERVVHTSEMSGYHKMLFTFVHRCLVPRLEGRGEANCRDLVMMELLDTETSINLPAIMIKHISKVASVGKQLHSLPYGFFLSKILDSFEVNMEDHRIPKVTDYLGKLQLEACGFIKKERGKGIATEGEQTPGTGPGARGSTSGEPGPSTAAGTGPMANEAYALLTDELRRLKESHCVMLESISAILDQYQELEAQYRAEEARNQAHGNSIDAALEKLFNLLKDSVEETIVEETVPDDNTPAAPATDAAAPPSTTDSPADP